MSLDEVLAELPALTVSERHLLIRKALELDDPPLSPDHEALVEKRFEELRDNPQLTVSLDEIKERLLTQFPK